MNYIVSPKQVHGSDYTLTPLFTSLEEGKVKLELMLSRQPDMPVVYSQDIIVFVSDSDGKQILPIASPDKELPEAGGGLGTTATAEYIFDFSKDSPKKMSIEYQGDKHVITIEATADSRE